MNIIGSEAGRAADMTAGVVLTSLQPVVLEIPSLSSVVKS
jgi:hypothetical protein